jgi:hypothetical protein
MRGHAAVHGQHRGLFEDRRQPGEPGAGIVMRIPDRLLPASAPENPRESRK